MYAPDLRPIRLALAIALILPLDSTLACGPSFPMRLLDDRANSLAELPEGNFAFEISRLAAPLPGLKPVTEASLVPRWEEDNSRYLQQRDERERSELGEERWRRVQALRALGDARRVEAEGAGLPAEILLYTAGAVAFRSDPEQAREYFRRVLALPAPERRTRSTWAAYSLGRLLAADSRALPAAAEALSDEEVARRLRANAEAAQEAFRLTRRLAIEGFDDPLELAAASLGEEALLAREANDWGEAIRLYANQAMLRSDTGYSSLRQLSGELARMPDERLEPLLAVPEVQQLLTVRLLTRGGWFYDEQLAGEQHLAELLMALDVAELPNADRLAALSYRYGRYDNAGRLLEKAGDSGLAWWLRAKLALRAGDTSRATEAYARAAKAFPEDEEWGVRRTADWEWETVKPRCRVEGESAILALQRGDYLEAFDNLYRSGAIYWLDAAAVAERVLTLDELKSYVDAKVPAPPRRPRRTAMPTARVRPPPTYARCWVVACYARAATTKPRPTSKARNCAPPPANTAKPANRRAADGPPSAAPSPTTGPHVWRVARAWSCWATKCRRISTSWAATTPSPRPAGCRPAACWPKARYSGRTPAWRSPMPATTIAGSPPIWPNVPPTSCPTPARPSPPCCARAAAGYSTST